MKINYAIITAGFDSAYIFSEEIKLYKGIQNIMPFSSCFNRVHMDKCIGRNISAKKIISTICHHLPVKIS